MVSPTFLAPMHADQKHSGRVQTCGVAYTMPWVMHECVERERGLGTLLCYAPARKAWLSRDHNRSEAVSNGCGIMVPITC